jgi:hypothetical protein
MDHIFVNRRVMPYKIVQHGNKFSVVAQNTGHVAGTHDSKKKAQAQMAALYANEPEANVKKCMTCGCEDLGNDHHYISETEKCAYCIDKGQGPCWEGYQYAGTKEKDGKTVPNCIPVKKESVGAGRIGGGVGFKLEYNVPDCLGGWAVTKQGTGQVIGCYTTKAHAEEAMKTIAVNEPDVTKRIDIADPNTVAGTLQQEPQQDGDDEMNFWTGAFSPFAHREVKGEPMTPIYNSPPQHDGEPSVGYGNSSSPKGKSNS